MLGARAPNRQVHHMGCLLLRRWHAREAMIRAVICYAAKQSLVPVSDLPCNHCPPALLLTALTQTMAAEHAEVAIYTAATVQPSSLCVLVRAPAALAKTHHIINTACLSS